jgi:hypothetical protein
MSVCISGQQVLWYVLSLALQSVVHSRDFLYLLVLCGPSLRPITTSGVIGTARLHDCVLLGTEMDTELSMYFLLTMYQSHLQRGLLHFLASLSFSEVSIDLVIGDVLMELMIWMRITASELGIHYSEIPSIIRNHFKNNQSLALCTSYTGFLPSLALLLLCKDEDYLWQCFGAVTGIINTFLLVLLL